jgi:hypothetical protein
MQPELRAAIQTEEFGMEAISKLEQCILEVLRSVESSEPNICATELFCEGWLMRLTLSAWKRGINCLPFAPACGSRWFAGAHLYSAFLAEERGDVRAEKHSEADTVVGQFDFGSSKTGVRLLPMATQFVVLEGKVFSKLRPGTKNALQYDQAARSVGCMAEVLKKAGRTLSEYQSLGFFVLAPEQQIKRRIFERQMDRQHIYDAIVQRVSAYQTGPEQEKRRRWLDVWVRPLVKTIELDCISWEDIIQRIFSNDSAFGAELKESYEKCLRHGGPNRGIPVPGQPFSVLPV